MQRLGYPRLVAAVAETNIPALVAAYDHNTESVSGLEYSRFMLWRRTVAIPDVRARLEQHLAASRALRRHGSSSDDGAQRASWRQPALR